jgi:hypothetical protein
MSMQLIDKVNYHRYYARRKKWRWIMRDLKHFDQNLYKRLDKNIYNEVQKLIKIRGINFEKSVLDGGIVDQTGWVLDEIKYKAVANSWA